MAAFDVSQFRAQLKNGGARVNQFKVELNFPTGVAGGTNAQRASTFLVNVAELPGQTINPAIVLYRGREVKFAGDRLYGPWTTTVLNDTQFTVRTAIERWMNLMDDLQDKTGETSPSAYLADLTVTQLDRNGEELKKYFVRDAFPVDLSPVGLDFGGNDQISQFTCTWQYQDLVIAGNAGAVV